jgi:5'-nucleotidase
MAKPLFLLSNDDGVHAPGIRALKMAVEGFADVVVCAPHVERSGSGHGISLTAPLRMERIESNVYAVEGTPTDCVMFALAKLLDRKPDWVLSGINRGSNIGQDTLYSGTVAAAMEGCVAGIPAMAVSLQARRAFELTDYLDAVKVVRVLFDNMALLEPARTGVLNVNIPHLPVASIKGFRTAALGRRIYEGAIVSSVDPRGRPYYWIGGGGEEFVDIPGSDCNLLAEDYVTLSVLKPDHVHQAANDALRQNLGQALDEALERL